MIRARAGPRSAGAQLRRAWRGDVPSIARAAILGIAGALGTACGSEPTAPPAGCTGYPSQASSLYALPYPVGESFQVVQGNCTARAGATHAAGGPFEYAYDFGMQIGTPVLAARAGTVAAVEGRYTDGNRVGGQENYVFVRHHDGSIGRYYHLTQGGPLVVVGAAVERGALLGLSGDTGNSRGPHLHFDVAACPAVGCATRPVTFRNTVPHPAGLEPGASYLAEPWQ